MPQQERKSVKWQITFGMIGPLTTLYSIDFNSLLNHHSYSMGSPWKPYDKEIFHSELSFKLLCLLFSSTYLQIFKSDNVVSKEKGYIFIMLSFPVS